MENHIKPITTKEKQSWQSVAFIWFGASLSMSGIVAGTAIAQSANFYYAVLAALIGYAIIILITVLQAFQGSDTGLPTAVISRKIFGSSGSRILLSAILAISLIGWFGIQGGVAGSAIAQYFADLGMNLPVSVWVIIVGLLMTLTAMYGVKSMKILNYIAVPFMVIILVWAAISAFISNDISTLFTYEPVVESSVFKNIATVVGGFIVGAVIASDYTRYNKSRKDTLKSTFYGIVPIGIFLKLLGVILAIFVFSTTKSTQIDIYQIILEYVPVKFFVFLMILLATWTTNVGNAYSGGLAISNAFNLSSKYHKYAILVSGLIGTLLAVAGILGQITTFLSFLTALVAPIAGVMIGEYWIINKGSKELNEQSSGNYPLAIISWFIGCIPYLLIQMTTMFNTLLQVEESTFTNFMIQLSSYTAVLGILLSLIIYVLVRKLTIQKEVAYG